MPKDLQGTYVALFGFYASPTSSTLSSSVYSSPFPFSATNTCATSIQSKYKNWKGTMISWLELKTSR